MRALKIYLLVLVLFAGFVLFGQVAEAQKTPIPYHGGGSSHGGSSHGGGYHGGSSHGGYHGSYHGYHGYHSRFYYPYYYRPFGFYGYGFGYPYWGYGYGYPAYGYGYAYPSYYSYYGYGEVKLDVKPKDAQVFVDGDYVGTVDDFNSWYQHMNIEPGKHRIVIRQQGYAPYTMDLRVMPGQNYKIQQQMHPGNDAIPENEMRLPESEYRRYSDQDRDRYQDRYQQDDRDREYDRRSPPPQDQQQEDPDEYNRNIEPQQPYGSDGQQSSYRQNSPGKTMMTFQVEPKDATIYIDGNYYGSVDGQNNNEIQVLLADGSHRLEVVRPGYATFSKDIQVNDSATHSLTIQLEKK
jgi:hypothetical protein